MPRGMPWLTDMVRSYFSRDVFVSASRWKLEGLAAFPFTASTNAADRKERYDDVE